MTQQNPQTMPRQMTSSEVKEELERLSRARKVAWLPRVTGLFVIVLVAASWLSGTFDFGSFFTERTATNLDRFLKEIRPHPLWDRSFDVGILWNWIVDTLAGHGTEAILVTLGISIAAIVLAGVGGLLLALPASRTLASPHPYLERSASSPAFWGWRLVRGIARFVLIFMRAIPEYVWAFLLVALLGTGAWPAVLALALHNLGILGKLYGDAYENFDQPLPASFRARGAGRTEIAAFALFPVGLGRFLLYFFYRWETCVREATVLGLLGVVSLGWYIQDARARTHYDEMVLYVLLGAVLILIGDLVSALARREIRRN